MDCLGRGERPEEWCERGGGAFCRAMMGWGICLWLLLFLLLLLDFGDSGFQGFDEIIEDYIPGSCSISSLYFFRGVVGV